MSVFLHDIPTRQNLPYTEGVTQWEYQFISDLAHDLGRKLAEMGLEGWEACGMMAEGMSGSSGRVTILIKRPIPPVQISKVSPVPKKD